MTDFPLVLDEDAAGASHGIDDVESSGRPREYQDDDLDAADMHAFSMESTASVYNGEQFSCRLKEPILTPLKTVFRSRTSLQHASGNTLYSLIRLPLWKCWTIP